MVTVVCTYSLSSSDVYRTIKLFLVGKGESGKTTLLRRLRSASDHTVERTEGIDIVDFTYTPTKSLFFSRLSQKPIHFLAWDFAGQVCYVVYVSVYVYVTMYILGSLCIQVLSFW